MHIPVLLAGFLAGPASGIVVGLLAPGLSHLLTGMPPTYAVAPMTMELAMYGLMAGITYQRLRINIYLSLIVSMLVGRLLFGLGLFVLGMLMQLPYSAAAYFSGGLALVTGLPGIALQLVLIPIIVAAVNRKRGGR
jgi:riboflavin transporter FmnP